MVEKVKLLHGRSAMGKMNYLEMSLGDIATYQHIDTPYLYNPSSRFLGSLQQRDLAHVFLFSVQNDGLTLLQIY